jgi:hypothetical protein
MRCNPLWNTITQRPSTTVNQCVDPLPWLTTAGAAPGHAEGLWALQRAAGAHHAESARGGARRAAGLDEGLLSLTLSNLLYMENPYSHKKCR